MDRYFSGLNLEQILNSINIQILIWVQGHNIFTEPTHSIEK